MTGRIGAVGIGALVAVGSLSLAVVLYVGVLKLPQPDQFHSVGIAAESDPRRGSTQPFPPACRRAARTRWDTIRPVPETAIGATNDAAPSENVQYSRTCEQLLKREPPQLLTAATGRGLRVDMVIHVEPKMGLLPFQDQCGEATVDVVVSGTKSFWDDHPTLHQAATRLAVGWDAETHPTGTTGLPTPVAAKSIDPQAPLHPAFFPDSELAWPTAGQAEPLALKTKGNAWTTKISSWGGELDQDPIQFRFAADWVEKRGVGSCYVVLPTFSANGALPGQKSAVCALARPQRNPVDCDVEEVTDLLSYASPPTHGRTVVSMEGGALDLEQTTPAPSDYESVWRPGSELEGRRDQLVNAEQSGADRHAAPVWTCLPSQDLSYLREEAPSRIPPAGSYTGNACGAIAVVEPPSADEIRTTIVVVGSVLFAVAVEALITLLFLDRRRRPASRPE